MQRREFIAGRGSAAAWPVVARPQQAALPVIGFLNPVAGMMQRYLAPFAQGLAETGYVLGRDVTIESLEGDMDRQAALAADLVRRRVAVIVAAGGAAGAGRQSGDADHPGRFWDAR